MTGRNGNWKRPRGRPRQTWIRQLELSTSGCVQTLLHAWDMASDQEVWRAQSRPPGNSRSESQKCPPLSVKIPENSRYKNTAYTSRV